MLKKPLISDYTTQAIGLYFVVLIIISALYINHVMPVQWIVSGAVQTLFFFLLLPRLMSAWQTLPEKSFKRTVFGTALFIRIAYVFISYAMYMYYTGSLLNSMREMLISTRV